jgi:hypothetical protein
MPDPIVIYQPWGGLGDNLQFSTLPRLYTEKGYDVYISRKNVYRNPEIYDLVWASNPYVKGVSDSSPNAGSCAGYREYDESNCIKNIELSHGLSNGNNKYPELYYVPKIIPELKDTILYDTTSISSSYSDNFITQTFRPIFDKYQGLQRKRIVFTKIPNREISGFHDDILHVNSIYEYCDIIASCKVFLCLFSGSSVLASAIKQDNPFPKIYCAHHTPPGRKSDIYFFENINFLFS